MDASNHGDGVAMLSQDSQTTTEIDTGIPFPQKRQKLETDSGSLILEDAGCQDMEEDDENEDEDEDEWSGRMHTRYESLEPDDNLAYSATTCAGAPVSSKQNSVDNGACSSSPRDVEDSFLDKQRYTQGTTSAVNSHESMREAPSEMANSTATCAENSISKKTSGSAGLTGNVNVNVNDQLETKGKRPKKRSTNVWAKSSSRKGGKKSNKKDASQQNIASGDCVYIVPALKNQDKVEDGPDQPVVLSKFQKAERIELSEDRLTAGSTKGYRMVRATRGVVDGAWFFEITIQKLGPTGHTRLGWSTQKGEIQAPVGFDSNSYGYRDIDGSKVHVAMREAYGQAYGEGDVIGFYINLPNGAELAPKPPPLVSYKGRPYIIEEKEDAPKTIPGSEIIFFRNGIHQGTAFRDLLAGRYFPAASMYTLPNEPTCTVKFNFGPKFAYPVRDLGERPLPQPMCSAPHCGAGSVTATWKSELQPQKAEEDSF